MYVFLSLFFLELEYSSRTDKIGTLVVWAGLFGVMGWIGWSIFH